MTISLSDNTPRISYTVNEGATQTAFTVPFEFFAGTDLNFYVDGTKKTITTHYTVTGGDGATGTINTTSGNSVTGASGGSTVIITRSIALERTTDFPISGGFEISSLNTELDRFIGIQADLQDGIDRGLHLADDDTAVSMELPLVAVRKGTVLGFNATTGAAEVGPTIANVSSLSAITANISTVAGIASNVTTVAGIASNVTTVAGISSNVTTVAGNTSNINSVVSNATNINTVAGSISNVNSVGGSIADVNTIAGISSDVTAVAADATDIGVVAGKAAEIGRLGTAAAVADLDILATTDAVGDMNTLAAISSNITTVANIASNVTSVAGVSSLITSDFVSDLNTLATTDIVSDLNTLATADIVTDLNTLATSDIVSDINILATSDIVSDINTLATSDIVSDLNTLATSDIVTDLNLLATSAIVEDLNLLATSSVIADMATLAGSGANPNITTLTASGAIAAGSLDVTGTITADYLAIGTTSDSYSQILINSSSTGESELRMGDTDTDAGSVSYTNSNDTMTFRAAAGARMALNSTGLDVTGTVTSDGLTVDGDVSLSEASPTIVFTDTTDSSQHLVQSINTTFNIQGQSVVRLSTAATKRFDIDNGGDISFYEDTGTTAKFFWDASTERLGIGNAAPNTTLDITTTSNTNGFRLNVIGTAPNYMFDVRDDGTSKFRIDESGNVGIATSSITSGFKMEVIGDARFGDAVGDDAVELGWSAGGSQGFIQAYDRGASAFRPLNLNNSMIIDSSGNVGIGTSSGVRKLEIAGNNNGGAKANYIRITDTDTSATAGNQQGGIEFYTSDGGNENVTASIENLYAGSGAGSELTFNTAPNGSSGVSEGFRLDENGNLLVGTTDDQPFNNSAGSTADNGLALKDNGQLQVAAYKDTANTGSVVYFNRTSTDGDIIDFRKDGGAVGSIGTASSYMVIGSPVGSDAYLLIGNDLVHPATSTGAAKDASIDIGGSSNRFKDLYLSGGVVFDAVAGNATSNTLDDYEEGTWTVEMYDALSGGNASSTQVTGRYIKIGKQVTASFDAFNNVSTSGLTSGNTVYFTLPFAASTTGRACGSCQLDAVTFPTGTTMITPSVSDSNSRAQLSASGSATADSTIKVSSFNGTSSDVANFTLSYRTAS